MHVEKEQLGGVIMHDSEHVTETAKKSPGLLGTSRKNQSVKQMVIQKVPESWKVSVSCRIFCYAAGDPAKDFIDVLSQDLSTMLVTAGSKKAPFPL